MAIDEFKRGALQAIAKWKRSKGCSIANIARALKISWTYAKKLLSDAPSTRKERAVSSRVALRRVQVRKMALKIRRVRHPTRGMLKEPQYPSAISIARVLGVSKSTVVRDLRACNLVCRVRKTMCSLDPKVASKRLLFANDWLRKSDCTLKKIVFSDEHVVTLNDSGKRTQWIRRGTKKTCPRERKSQRNASPIMVWGAIGHNYKKLIVLHTIKRKYPRGRPRSGEPPRIPYEPYRLTATKYQNHVLALIQSSLRSRIFQQDGARPHISGETIQWLRRHHIQLMDSWPPYSPHLSPVENMWPLLNAGITERRPYNEETLIQAAHDAWEAIPQSVVNAAVLSFRRRLEETQANDGLE